MGSPRSLRIAEAGLGGKCAALLEAAMPLDAIVATLNAEGAEALREHQMLDLTVRDVRDYKDFLENMETGAVNALVRGEYEEKRLVARIHERVKRTLDMMDKLEEMASDIMEDFRRGRKEWREGAPLVLDGANGSQKVIYPPYPGKQVALLTKIVGESRSIVQAFQQDKGVQSFIKNATVNVNQNGMSQKDIYQVLRFMSKELNIPMERIMEAWGEGQEALSTRRGPIDV